MAPRTPKLVSSLVNGSVLDDAVVAVRAVDDCNEIVFGEGARDADCNEIVFGEGARDADAPPAPEGDVEGS